MRAVFFSACLFAAASALAGPGGEIDRHAHAPTGFPGAYIEALRLSLADDPTYGSRFLDALQLHVRSVAVMTSRRAVAGYLEQAAAGGRALGELREGLGTEILPPPHAAALLVADALARPEQFREILERLETLQLGLGVHSAEILRASKGSKKNRALAALRFAAARRSRHSGVVYGADQRWVAVFDADPDPPAGPAPAEEGRVKSHPSLNKLPPQ